MQAGLYSPEQFKDNCGFGLIAHMQGQPSHKLLNTAIESLTCMTHRGGIASDGKTGDGCGILMQKPDSFFRIIAKESLSLELPQRYAVGAIFLPTDDQRKSDAIDIFDAALQNAGLQVLGWREIPVDSSVCGPIALESLPSMQHVFIDLCGKPPAESATALFVARRKAELALTSEEDFYVVLNAGCKFTDMDHIKEHTPSDWDVSMEYSEENSLVAVQGPKA